MERLNDEGQWIVLMGFMVCVGIFFLAIVITQSTVVGQTTSEAVLEFPKTEIQDLRSELISLGKRWDTKCDPPSEEISNKDEIRDDIVKLALYRKNAVVYFDINENSGIGDAFNDYTRIILHYNNGVTEYDETFLLSRPN